MQNAVSIQSARHEQNRERLVERLLSSAAGAFEIFSVYLGDRLGLYTVLADEGPLNAAELARRTGSDTRYVREWLEQQAVIGLVDCANPAAAAEERRFNLPAGHDEVLADSESLDFMPPVAQTIAGAVRPLAQLVDAFRSGAGIPYESYGEEFRNGQARLSRNLFLQQLGEEYLPSIPELHARLQRPGAKVADIGCGFGWSSIGLASSYPGLQVDGFDLDAPSVERARTLAVQHGVGERVRFQAVDAATVAGKKRYDLVTAFECIHDLARPVEVLRTMRELVADDGTVLVMDERVADRFADATAELDGFMYGWSILHCLPVGRSEDCSACTGTVMRADTLRAYAREAGFSDLEVLPIDNYFFRFYRLLP